MKDTSRRRKRQPRQRQAVDRVCVSVTEFSQATGISRPVLYRMMDDGRLRYTQLTSDMRRIPTSEYLRLGLSGQTA
jgi:predicted DNA-binding transcriptional regulator AlpA